MGLDEFERLFLAAPIRRERRHRQLRTQARPDTGDDDVFPLQQHDALCFILYQAEALRVRTY